jgi:hypothetical protein
MGNVHMVDNKTEVCRPRKSSQSVHETRGKATLETGCQGSWRWTNLLCFDREVVQETCTRGDHHCSPTQDDHSTLPFSRSQHISTACRASSTTLVEGYEFNKHNKITIEKRGALQQNSTVPLLVRLAQVPRSAPQGRRIPSTRAQALAAFK